jgi:Ca-activated chloride channel family protein
MRSRATLAAAIAAALLLAAPAAAQDATPIVGGGSFTDAPIIEPGTYRDTVLPEEYLYYGVRVGAGQRLRVTLDAGLTSEEFSDLGVAYVNVNLHGPDRAFFFDSTGPRGTSGRGSEPSDVITDPALPVSETRDSVANSWVGPGVYFLAVYAVFVGSGELTKAEIPVTFTVALEGQAQTEATPTPSPTPSPSPSPAPTATAAAPAAEEQDSTPMAAAGAGVAGLLAGVVGGIVLRRQRRR